MKLFRRPIFTLESRKKSVLLRKFNFRLLWKLIEQEVYHQLNELWKWNQLRISIVRTITTIENQLRSFNNCFNFSYLTNSQIVSAVQHAKWKFRQRLSSLIQLQPEWKQNNAKVKIIQNNKSFGRNGNAFEWTISYLVFCTIRYVCKWCFH